MTGRSPFDFDEADRSAEAFIGRRPKRERVRKMQMRYAPLALAGLGLVALAGLAVAWFALVPLDPTRVRLPPEAMAAPPAVEPVQLMPIAPEAAIEVNEKRPFDIDGPIAPAPGFRFVGSEVSRGRAVACLAAAAWYEAGDDLLGEQSVIQVVLNRARHPAFPRTVCGVVFQGSERETGCQFTFTCDGSIQRRRPSAAGWARASALASSMLNGHVDPRVGVASHYHANFVVPYWAPSLVKLAQVRTHIFYTWKGRWGSSAALRAPGGAEEPGIGALAGLSAAHAAAAGALAAAEGESGLEIPKAGPVASELGVGDRALRGAIVRGDEASAGRYFIQVDPGTFVGNHAVAALALCKGRESCRVYGWRDAGAVAGKLPLSDHQRDTLAFLYSHEEGRADHVLWDCSHIPRANKAQCLPTDAAERLALLR